jgi:hypothetical protein
MRSETPHLAHTCAQHNMSLKPSAQTCRYLYCNLPGLEFVQGERARIYFMALGGIADMHTPTTAEGHFSIDGHRKQALPLLPGTMVTTDTT